MGRKLSSELFPTEQLASDASMPAFSSTFGAATADDERERLILIAQAKYKYEQEQKKQQESNVLLDAAKAVGSGALKALDYTGGYGRTAVQQVGDLVSGQDQASWGDAVTGNAKGMGRYMEDIGAPEMGSVDVPLLGKITGRGVLGFAGDVATDPLTYLSAGLSAAAKGQKLAGVGGKLAKAFNLADHVGDAGKTGAALRATTDLAPAAVEVAADVAKVTGPMSELTQGGKILNKVLNPLEVFNRERSPKLYDKAFAKIADRIEGDFNKKGLAAFAEKEGFAGTAKDFVELLEAKKDEAGKILGSAREAASKDGVKVNAAKAFTNFGETIRKRIKELPDSDVNEKVKNQLLNELKAHIDKSKLVGNMSTGEVPIGYIQAWKEDLGKRIQKAFSNVGSEPSLVDDILVDLERGMAGEIDNSMENYLTEKGLKGSLQKYMDAKKVYSLASHKPLRAMKVWAREVKELKNPLTPSMFDMALGGGGATAAFMGGGPTALGALAAKKAGEAALSTVGRTSRAKMAGAIGRNANSIPDTAIRASLLELLGQRDGEKKK